MPAVPLSTYRLQLHSGFDFDKAGEVAEYIADLGVSHIYCSPYLQASPGSTHGYDVVDHRSVNVELGGAAGHERFSKRLKARGLGQVLDIVPNHMSLAENNRYWWDVLENGPQSRYAQYFDIDWESGEARMRNKVLLPILDDQYGVVLAGGSIRIVRNGARFEVICAAQHLPVAPHSMAVFLAKAAEGCKSDTLGFLADSFALLLPGESDDPVKQRAKQQRNTSVLFTMLDRVCADEPGVFACMDVAIAAVNADTDALDDFLQQQNYRIAHWRVADEDLGYRRFFDVNSLIGLRMEREAVFSETHALILEWLKTGVLDGVRVDHPDGLREPERYFERLRAAAPDAWIVIEKILAKSEPLRPRWPVDGTTGYEFLNAVNGLLVSPEGLTELEQVYRAAVPDQLDYTTLVHDKKVAVMQEGLGSDVNRLTAIFLEICDRDRDHRDYSRAGIRRAIREMAAAFPVYRTYVSPERDEVVEIDAAVIQVALDKAIQHRSDVDSGLFEFMADVLLMRSKGELETEFLHRFQQFTGPVMAKGFEDTVLYCYNRLVGLNDVGSDPCNAAVSIEDFHRFNMQNQQYHPTTMVTLTTHDTKRGEDVRARLAVLSEVPQRFAEAQARWAEMTAQYRDESFADANTEYLYYQTLIGAWPINDERMIAYMEKATREAKQKTSWSHNNEAFEEGMRKFIRATLGDEVFTADLAAFVAEINSAGRVNSLAQTLLKCTVPGVPDLYQGCELWDHRLVDPDNRTPVDYAVRMAMLAKLDGMAAEAILDGMEDGLPKMWTIRQALQVRAKMPECFGADGAYEAVAASGLRSEHVVAFMRAGRVVAVAPRLTHGVRDGWADTAIELPQGRWRNAMDGADFAGGQCGMNALLERFPVALLVRED